MNNEKYRYKIDPEFRDLIPPLTQSEYEELEKSILSEGCRESIYTWNDYIIDGHNRYEICIKHGLEPPVFPMVFESREEVIIWICSVQLSRRNVTEPIRRYLIGKRYEAEKLVGAHNASGCNQYSRPEKEVRYQSDTEAPFNNDIVRTRDRLGKEYNLASATVYRYGEYAKTIDKIKEHSPNVAKDRKAGSIRRLHFGLHHPEEGRKESGIRAQTHLARKAGQQTAGHAGQKIIHQQNKGIFQTRKIPFSFSLFCAFAPNPSHDRPSPSAKPAAASFTSHRAVLSTSDSQLRDSQRIGSQLQFILQVQFHTVFGETTIHFLRQQV